MIETGFRLANHQLIKGFQSMNWGILSGLMFLLDSLTPMAEIFLPQNRRQTKNSGIL